MSETAIRVEGLGKQYRIGIRQGAYNTLRDQLAEMTRRSFRALRPSRNGDKPENLRETIWALKDISFEVRQGEVVGIIGRNGAGKSTLLKVLSRITEPTVGCAELRGRVGSLLEVGTGFHPELTGRENVYLNGAILGMRRSEIQRKFDEIVAFSEIERFIDTPVKHYSSGMYLRLAFAVAAHLEPEILLVDEVLAVGDASFQRKCLGKMGEVSEQGRTVFLVSHNLAAVNQLCRRAFWLDGGSLRASGDVESVVSQYLATGFTLAGEATFPDSNEAPGSEYVRLRAVRICDGEGQLISVVDMRRQFVIEVEYQILRPASNLRIGFTLMAQDASVVLTSNDADGENSAVSRKPGTYFSRCSIPGEFLNKGSFSISVGADFPMVRSHFYVDRVLSFHVESTGGVGGCVPDHRPGAVRVRFPWQVRTAA